MRTYGQYCPREIVQAKDVGTLQYDTYFNETSPNASFSSGFRDSDALILHGQNMAPLMESIMATGTVSGELLGDLSEALPAQMADGPVGLFTVSGAIATLRDELRRRFLRSLQATKPGRRGSEPPKGPADERARCATAAHPAGEGTSQAGTSTALSALAAE